MTDEIKNDEILEEEEVVLEEENTNTEEFINEIALDQKKQKDFYLELRKRIKKYVQKHPNSKYINYIVAAPDLFHLLCKLMFDKRVPLEKKGLIAAAIVYFFSPIDIISDFIPGIGILDDVIIAVNVVNSLISSVSPDVIEELWAGDEDVWVLIKKLLKFADSVVGYKVYDKIKKWFETKNNSEK